MADFTISEDFPKNEMEFDKRFSDPQSCYDYLFQQKWPNGFICKKCGQSKYWVGARNLYICANYGCNHSLIAGTIMDSSKKRITYWFKAMWWFTTMKRQAYGFRDHKFFKLKIMAIHQTKYVLTG